MKRFFSNILIATLLALNITSATSAVTLNSDSSDPADTLSDSTDLLFTFSPQNLGETLSGYYNDLIDSEVTGYSYYDTETSDYEDAYYAALREVLKNNSVSLGLQFVEEEVEDQVEEEAESSEETTEEYIIATTSYSEPYYYGLLPMDEDIFNNEILANALAYQEENELLGEDASIEDPISYYATVVGSTSAYDNPFDSGSFAYFNGNLVLAESTEQLEALFSNTNVLSSNSTYSNIASFLDYDSILNFYFTDIESSFEEILYGYGSASESLSTIQLKEFPSANQTKVST